MADAKVIVDGSALSGNTTAIPDNTSNALDIESTDAKDYVTISTDDSNPSIILGKDGAEVGVGVASPDALLHVQDTAISTTRPTFNAGTVAIFENDTNCAIQILTKDTGSSIAEINMGGTGEDREGNLRYITSEQKMEVGPRNASSKMGLYTAGSQRVHIDASGKTAVGASTPKHLLHVQDGDLGIVTNNASDVTAKTLVFTRSRSNTEGTAVVVQDDDILGNIEFQGAEDGDSFATGAKIFARVNGTPGDGDMPTELVFQTSPDGSETPTTRMSIGASGVIATTASSGGVFTFNRDAKSVGFRIDSNIGLNTSGGDHLEILHGFKKVADFDGETLLLQNTSSTSSSTSSGGLWVNLANTCASSGTGNKTIASTAHGLLVGDAVSLPSGSGGNYEVFKVQAVGDADEFTTDTNLANSISSATGKTDGNKLVVKTGHGDTSFVVKGNGRVGVNVTSPAHPIDVVGTAGLSTGTAWTNTSDSRVKTDVQGIEGALDKINQLRPVSFKYTDDYLSVHNEIDGSKRYNSFIAQEYAEVFPDAVTISGNLERVVTKATDDTDEVREVLLENVQQFTPHDLNMYLVKAVQELTARVAELETGD